MGQRIEVNVTITDGADIETVAKALASLGFIVGQLLHGIGVITGQADDAALASFESAAGVASVERGRRVGVAPPDSSVQ